MNTLQYAVLILIHLLDPKAGWFPPSQEHHTSRPTLRHNINDLLSKAFPSFTRMAVCFVCPYRKACIQQQDATVRPWGQQSSVLRRRLEVGVVLLECFVYILKGGWGRRRCTHGEAQAVGLVDVVIGVLA